MASRIPVPPRNFDVQLEAFLSFLDQNKITLIGVQPKQLAADLTAQRGQKQKDYEAKRQYQQIHRKFQEEQAVRYKRFGTALQVVRAANRGNEDILQAMEQFKRPRKKSASKSRKAVTPPIPAHP